ncbi:hypothetical protein ABID19_003182 [Mesorhizobium robiniae]|uniref:Transposase n=1 Tax=Mesorhizobium robiniae TaxID=559315 RepID=A0ABV2GPD3_9HYPH
MACSDPGPVVVEDDVDAHDGCDVRQAQFTGKGALAFEPAGLVADVKVVAKAETRCSGDLPALLSWLRREVLPSMATKSGLSS